jgi:DNA primase
LRYRYRRLVAYARDDIDTVRDKTDLVELASEITKVKRSGRSTMAVCPFHSEKTPSLSIDGARGLYHCFGCGKSGDVYRWVQETQGLDFAGAVEFLARRAGVVLKVDPEAAKRRSNRERLVEATSAAVAFYTERLRSGADAGPARSYLRGRGYDADVVDRFSLGYSPDAWDQLVNHLRESGIGDDTLTASGLASRSSKGSLIDRFRGRVMFPIFDVRGDAVGFGARVLEGDGPKYLNSSESPIYHKSRLLYGLNWAKSDIVRADTSVVVEGYTDVIAMHLAGLPIAVATCGTALGEDHLDLLRRFSERVVFAFDADEAGAGAAIRGFDRSVPGDLDLRVAVLPDGKDPADVVADGDMERLRDAIGESRPLLRFRIETELSRFDLTEPEARAKAVRSAAAIIGLHPDPVTRHEYAVMVSRDTGVELRFVEAAMRQRGPSSLTREVPPDEALPGDPSAAAARSATYRTEAELVRVILANDARLEGLDIDEKLFADGRIREAFVRANALIADLAPGAPPDLGTAIGSEDSPSADLLRTLAMDVRPIADPVDLVNILDVAVIDREISMVRQQLQQVDEITDEQGYSELFQRLIALEHAKRNRRRDRDG